MEISNLIDAVDKLSGSISVSRKSVDESAPFKVFDNAILTV